MTDRRLVTLHRVEPRQDLDAPTVALPRDQLTTVPRAVTEPLPPWRRALGRWLGTFGWGCFAAAVVIGLATWGYAFLAAMP